MSKRANQPREGARPADHGNTTGLAVEEPQFSNAGTAFDAFEAMIEAELEQLVARWIHTAAPCSAIVRRAMPNQSKKPRKAK